LDRQERRDRKRRIGNDDDAGTAGSVSACRLVAADASRSFSGFRE
jgi:hypothetical protein